MANSWSVDNAVAQFFEDGFKDGDLISRDWILYALDLSEVRTNEDSLRLLDRMESFRKALLEDHQIALQNVRGKGYRVVPPAEQAEYAARTAAALIEKGLHKGSNLLDNTRMDVLSDDERRRHTDTENRMAGLRGMVNKGRRDVLAAFTK